ncbi:MAG TPA: magnesium/cobalt transporter CorA [Thermoanaerobaculia bacterium]|nr:magnesium/cobalt transporter CorA [Thermoanaerobaculia bacterium]
MSRERNAEDEGAVESKRVRWHRAGRRLLHHREPPAGSRPGTLIAPEDAQSTQVRAVLYDEDGVEEVEVDDLDDVKQILADGRKCWVDVRGLGSPAAITAIADLFHVHPLALEDAVNVPQRPDTHVFETHQQVVARGVMADSRPSRIEFEQITLFVGERTLLTIQEHIDDTFEAIRVRLRQGKGPIRRLASGYLAYAILDTIIDGYFPMFEQFGDHLEDLESLVLVEASPLVIDDVNAAKKDLLMLRRALWPQREMVASLVREPTPFFDSQTQVYLHDCYDHCIQLLDVVETYREMASGLMSTYLSAVGNRTNEVMKVLTIMATIFIPLTFIAGIYGMNFAHMPELAWRWSYPILLAGMGVLAVGMLAFFRRLGWLGGRRGRARRRARLLGRSGT